MCCPFFVVAAAALGRDLLLDFSPVSTFLHLVLDVAATCDLVWVLHLVWTVLLLVPHGLGLGSSSSLVTATDCAAWSLFGHVCCCAAFDICLCQVLVP
ncbi:hypothetical protein QYF36_011943 [Acer negundo]|nr:hypothetical protein QYF36_011943 [Acer negundo]